MLMCYKLMQRKDIYSSLIDTFEKYRQLKLVNHDTI